ncbi:MAG: ribonuclease HI [Armatimonadetes bacterium]|nr:ribonuclease HI [Armatimonadota bacterium]
MRELQKVIIYTDGACIGNPGPGGYGIVLLYGTKRREISGGFRLTTNNRMEIMAAIVGLQALRYKCDVTLYTDSQYLVDSIMKGWAQRWRANRWMRNKKEKALNTDLWERLLDLCARHEIKFEWVRGHAGDRENERCDELSVQAALWKDLPPDIGYKREKASAESDLGLLESSSKTDDSVI